MDFSTIAFCSENKRRIDIRTFLSSEKLIHQSSNMGIHQSEGIPFVELTGNKMEEPIVHPPFQFDLAKSFGLTNKIHSLANNTKNSMKDTYNHQFSAIAFSPLVGGFVGSKSQVGSSSRESCQIWDVIFEKLAELCGGSQSEYHPLFVDKYSQTCYNLGKKISQEFLGSLCQKSASTVDTSKTTIGNYSNKLPEKITETMPRSHTGKTVSVPQSIATTNCMGSPSSGIVSCPPDLSKQSYAEVARTFAIAQQNKQQSTRTSTMHKARNSGHRDNKHKRRPRTSSSKDNWRYSRDSSINDCKNQRRMGFNNNRTNYNRNNKFVTNMGKENKAEKNKSSTDVTESQAQRIDMKNNMQNVKRNPVQSVSKEPSMHISYKKTNSCSQTVDSRFMYDNYNITSMKDESSVKPCISSNCSRSVDEVDDCAVFACKVEVGSIPLLIHAAENVQVSPKDTESYISSEESSLRSRFSSECSTDSDDSFVIFESNVECDAVFVTLMRPPSVSDSEISEDGIVFELSSDEECEDDDDDEEDDDDDTETITDIDEVNEKWQRDYSKYSGCERSPVKVHFASDSSVKTVHRMVVWNHAYRAARRGPWEQFARDRERFTSRIRKMEPVLAPVLCSDHRRRVWKERFADDSSNLRSQVT